MKRLPFHKLGLRFTTRFEKLLSEATLDAKTSAIDAELLSLYSHWLQSPETKLRLPNATATKTWQRLLSKPSF